MRQIKVSDETYERLSEMAKRSYRTLGGQIDFMVDTIGSEYPLEVTQLENNIPYQRITVTPMEKTTPKKIAAAPNPRHVKHILADISDLEEQIKDEEAFNQDAESRDRNITEWQAEINSLWAEYHELRGAN